MHPLLADLPASEKLGMFPFWDWLVNQDPGIAGLLMFLISPIAIAYVIRPLIEGRITRFTDDFLTFRMDAMLGPAMFFGLWLVDKMDDRPYLHGTAATVVGVAVILFWMGFGALHMWQERHDYSWRQGLSPSAIYHNAFLYIFMGYALTMVCVMGLIFAPWTFGLVVVRLLMLAFAATWALAWPLHDASNKYNRGGESKFKLAHPADGWPWQHKYQQLGWWLRRYFRGWGNAF